MIAANDVFCVPENKYVHDMTTINFVQQPAFAEA